MIQHRPRTQGAHTTFAVRLEEGGLRAVVRRLGAEVPTRTELDVECAKLRVVYGLDEAACDRFCMGRVPPGVDVVIAKGIEPVARLAPRVEYRFVLPKDNRSYTEAPGDAYVDHREGFLTERVAVGDVLAVRIPAVPGSRGLTVTGRELPAPETPGGALELGGNVALSEDGLRVVATASGTPTLVQGRIAVVVALEVPAVNYSTGNLHYDGPVVVRGDVASGFSVCAAGDIEVHGVVEGGTLISGGNITLRAGARHGSRIEAAGNVSVRFLDSDAEANAIGDVTVLGSAVQCRVSAGRSVRVANTVSGSVVRAGVRVDVDEAGGGRGTPSLLEIRREASEAQVAQLAGACDELRAYLEAHEVRARALPPTADVQTRKWFVAERVQVDVELAFARARLAACERDLQAGPTSGEVIVRKALRPGVDVVLHGLLVPPVATTAGLRFVHSARGRPYAPPSWIPPSSGLPPMAGLTPPPLARASLMPASRGVGPMAAPRGLTPPPFARPSLLPGARSVYPPAPRSVTPPPFARPSLLPGARSVYPPAPRSTTPPPFARPSLLPGSRASYPPMPRAPTPAPFRAPTGGSIARNPPVPRDEPTIPAPPEGPPTRR